MMRPITAAYSILLLVLFSVFAGCVGKHDLQTSYVERQPQRIVSLSPNVTEILYGIGAWPQVIAVS